MFRQLLIAGSIAGLLSGCATSHIGEKEAIHEAVQPTTAPVRTITNFSDSLHCMDGLLTQYRVGPIYITSEGLPDLTEKGIVGNGARHMLISAISKMTTQSQAVVFVDLPSNPLVASKAGVEKMSIETLLAYIKTIVLPAMKESPFKKSLVYPDYYITGGVLQVDDKVVSSADNLSGFVSKGDIGKSFDSTGSVISLDMNIGDTGNLQIKSGLTVSNSISVHRETNQYELGVGGLIGTSGLYYNVILDRKEGPQQALRTLIELSAVELIGKLSQVPYWQCLNTEGTSPKSIAQVRDWYHALSEIKRIELVQQALRRQGVYQGAVTGQLDATTRDAISRYQASVGLIATGQVDFELCRVLLGKPGTEKEAQQRVGPPAAAAGDNGGTEQSDKPLAVTLTAGKGQNAVYQVDEDISIGVSLTQDAFLYCYYEWGNGNVARIFPSRSRSSAFVRAGSTSVPGNDSSFTIAPEHPGSQEKFMCLATTKDVSSALPALAQGPGLQPLPIGSLQNVEGQFRQVAGADIALADLEISVPLYGVE